MSFMKKCVFIIGFLAYSLPCMAVPGRLQGFSYSGKIKPETEAFNEKPAIYDEEPTFPHYLNEDLSDARTGVSQNGDRHVLIPVYSMQDLYDRRNDYETGKFEEEDDEFYDDEE